ncbi:hypothetical protein GCM10023333_37670 [Ferrimonas pelagia]|uniref:PNPLA domain-containing protein n=1 Tax=Ferrimonas pelagia TaxID=1177826 RepID=A0ABP9FEY1_9GAMM
MAQLAETMKASSAMPVAYRGGVTLGDDNFVDGGVADAIPVAEAIRRGAKRLLILRSQTADYRKRAPASPRLLKHLLRKTPGLIAPMLQRAEQYNATLDLIRQPPKGVEIIEICPPPSFQLKRLTRSAAPLQQGYQLGLEAGVEAITRWHEADNFA